MDWEPVKLRRTLDSTLRDFREAALMLRIARLVLRIGIEVLPTPPVPALLGAGASGSVA